MKDVTLFENIIPKNKAGRLNFLLISPGNLVGDVSNLPLGIAILASILELNGANVTILDYNIKPFSLEEIRGVIERDSINIIGISAMTCQTPNLYTITEFVKSKDPSIMILAGGPHVSVLPDEALDYGVDIAVIGEGEMTLKELLPLLYKKVIEKMEIGEDLTKINGIAFIKEGKMMHTPERARIADLDRIPEPAYHKFEFPQKYVTTFLYNGGYSAGILTSRGCDGHCVFCAQPYHGVTMESPEVVFQRIKYLKEKFAIKQFFVQDDYFTYDQDRVIRICELLIKDKIDLPWVCSNTRADAVSLKMFQKMKESGCVHVSFGVESGDEEVRKKIGKNNKLSDIENAVKLAKKAGLYTAGFFIIGHYCDTVESVKETIRFAKKINTDAANFSINCPFPGTASYRIMKRNGWIHSEDWGAYRTFGEPLFHTDHFQPEDLKRIRRSAFLSYYVRPRRFFSQLRDLFTKKGSFLMRWRFIMWLLENFFDYNVLAKKQLQEVRLMKDLKTGRKDTKR